MFYRKKKTAKLLAAKNMLRIFDADKNLKQKMMEHIYGGNIGRPISEKSTNLVYIEENKDQLAGHVDSLAAQRTIASSKRFEEPQDILRYFQN